MADTRKRALEVAIDERKAKRQKGLDERIFALFSFECSVTPKGGALRAQVDYVELVPKNKVKAVAERIARVHRYTETRDGRRCVSFQRVIPIKFNCEPKYMLLRVQCFKQEENNGEWKLSVEVQSMAVASTRLETIDLLGRALYWKRRDERAYTHYLRQVKKMQRNCTMQALEVGPCWFQIVNLD
jgi:hypothetical protein